MKLSVALWHGGAEAAQKNVDVSNSIKKILRNRRARLKLKLVSSLNGDSSAGRYSEAVIGVLVI